MDNYLIAKATSAGQVRQVNEDSMTVFNSPNGQVMAVCDGMGGQAAGDVASQLAVDIIENILTDNTFDTPEEAIRRSVLAANQGVLNRTAQNPELEGMGSTCVMLIIRNGQVHCGWVGDSRIYYIANHTIRQLSHDQSFVQEMVDRGEITPEEALNHPQKNEITNAIGLQGMIAPNTLAVPITPEPGSVFLLCSDGLSSMVDDARIERTVSNAGMTLQQKADRLVEMANEAGGLDNITVELVQFGSGAGASNTTTAGATGISTQKKPGKGRLFGMIAVAFVLIAAVATGAYFIFGGQDEPVRKEVKQEVKPSPAKPTNPERGTSKQSSGSVKPQDEEKPAAQTAPASQPKNHPSSTQSEKKAKEITNKGSKKQKEEKQKEEKQKDDVKTEVERISESMQQEKDE